MPEDDGSVQAAKDAFWLAWKAADAERRQRLFSMLRYIKGVNREAS